MNILKSVMLMASITLAGLNSMALADDLALVVAVDRPAILDEGTQRELTAAQIAELLPWAKDSKNFLVDLLDNVQGLNTTDKIERLIEGIKSSVVDSAPKNSELMMRYALNRALVINTILDREMDGSAVGTADAKSRVLILSIKMALKYYDADMATLSNKSASPFASFGIEYFNFLSELNKSIFDASAQYNIQRTSLEWLQWDLYRDLNNAQYASQILKINNVLKTFPVKRMSDAQSISYIRQMKKTTEQLRLEEKAATRKQTIAQNEENIFSTATKEDNRFTKKNKGNFVSVYSSYYGTNYCYPSDANGNKLGDSKVDIENCQTGYVSLYSSYYGTNYCYASDSSNNKLGDSKVDISYCQKGYVSLYSSYYGTNYCYVADKSNNKLGDSKVDISLCQTGYVSLYSSYYGTNYCYPADKGNSKLGDAKVDNKFCQ